MVDGPVGDPPLAPSARHRVLVVDDEERLRKVLARILRDRGIEADTAADGKDAVAMTSSGTYELVILDVLMPG